MAVVKIRKVKATLAKSIAYVTDPAKTDGQRLASTTTGHDIADCDAIAAAFLNDLESTKGGSARKGAVLALHVIQSFDPDDPITSEQAHSLGERFVQEITAGRHDYVIATHTDRAHVHNHILICPADLTTGRAMRLTRGTLGRWRQVSDRLCEENGLKVIDPALGGRVSPDLAQLYASARGENAKDRLRALIDQACMASRDFDAFRRELERRGVRVTVRGRRLTYTVLVSGMRFSDRRLGVAYNMLAVMGKLERRVVHEIGFHDSLVARRTRTAVTVRVPGTRGRLRLTIPVERTIRDGQVWRAYLADGTRQVLTDQGSVCHERALHGPVRMVRPARCALGGLLPSAFRRSGPGGAGPAHDRPGPRSRPAGGHGARAESAGGGGQSRRCARRGVRQAEERRRSGRPTHAGPDGRAGRGARPRR